MTLNTQSTRLRSKGTWRANKKDNARPISTQPSTAPRPKPQRNPTKLNPNQQALFSTCACSHILLQTNALLAHHTFPGGSYNIIETQITQQKTDSTTATTQAHTRNKTKQNSSKSAVPGTNTRTCIHSVTRALRQ